MTKKCLSEGIGTRFDHVSVDEDMPPKKVWSRPALILPTNVSSTFKTLTNTVGDGHGAFTTFAGPS
jgi:hypothetical protein